MVPCPAVLALTIGLTCTAPVERIVDGDTAWMRFAGQSHKVRIIGIDTPERGEPGFKAATDAARARWDGRTARLTIGSANGAAQGQVLRQRRTRPLWPRIGRGRWMARDCGGVG